MKRSIQCLNRFILFALLIIASFSAWAELPKSYNFPGGLSLVPIGQYEQKPMVYFGIDPVLVIPNQDGWLAVVGVPMNLVPGKYILRVAHESDAIAKPEPLSFTVYPLHAKYKQRSYPLPPELSLNHFMGFDNLQLRALFQTPVLASDSDNPDFNFQHAVAKGNFLPYGRIMSRTDNRQISLSDHAKITYLASQGTIAYAPGSGTVENILGHGTSKQTIVIHHSDHFRSILSYLNNSPLKIGERVEVGQPIGTAALDESIGSGRIDWYVMLNSTEIDPLLLIGSPLEEE